MCNTGPRGKMECQSQANFASNFRDDLKQFVGMNCRPRHLEVSSFLLLNVFMQSIKCQEKVNTHCD